MVEGVIYSNAARAPPFKAPHCVVKKKGKIYKKFIIGSLNSRCTRRGRVGTAPLNKGVQMKYNLRIPCMVLFAFFSCLYGQDKLIVLKWKYQYHNWENGCKLQNPIWNQNLIQENNGNWDIRIDQKWVRLNKILVDSQMVTLAFSDYKRKGTMLSIDLIHCKAVSTEQVMTEVIDAKNEIGKNLDIVSTFRDVEIQKQNDK